MKISFDIKFRPQIESGEYKVVTGDDRPVRIISWDKKLCGGRYEIVALVPTPQGDTETVQLYSTEGILIASSYNEKFKLFIVTPEPELTPLEDLLSTYLKNDFEYFSTQKWDKKKWNEVMRTQAAELLNLAKKELCKGCPENLEGYIKGMEEARKERDKNWVYKHEGPTIPVYWPPCHYGGECTNPFRDCVNCPRGSVTVGINTSTGTSTAKMEGKDGND